MKEKKYNIGLIRHPPVDVPKGLCYGRSDVPLKEPWKYYANLSYCLNNYIIYSSPLSRCAQLAHQIALFKKNEVKLDSRLLEFNFGEWEGLYWDDIPRSLIDEWAKDPWDWVIPKGESASKLIKRVSEFWNEISTLQRDILVVSHAGPLRILKQLILKLPIELLGELPEFGQLQLFELENNITID